MSITSTVPHTCPNIDAVEPLADQEKANAARAALAGTAPAALTDAQIADGIAATKERYAPALEALAGTAPAAKPPMEDDPVYLRERLEIEEGELRIAIADRDRISRATVEIDRLTREIDRVKANRDRLRRSLEAIAAAHMRRTAPPAAKGDKP